MSYKITMEFIVDELEPEKMDIITFQNKLEEMQNEIEIQLDKHFAVENSLFEISDIMTRMR